MNAQRFTSTDTLAAAVVWGLVFSIANGFMEELWLRGIFLKRFEPVLANNGSVWLTCGYLIVESDSLGGAVIIHAASDFFLFIAVLANA